MKSSNPLISVCVLTYNHGQYIVDCLKSIMNTDYENLEIFIYDDDSRDNTKEKINEIYPELEKRFVSVSLELSDVNRGNIPANINRMIKKAKGEFIKTISGDDCLTKHYFDKMINYFEDNENTGVAMSNYEAVPDDFSFDPSCDEYENSTTALPAVDSDEVFFNLMLGNYLNAPSAMFRQSIFDKYGLYDENAIYEDYEMWLRLAKEKVSFGFIDEPLVIYRVAKTSISIFSNANDKKVKSWFDATFYIGDKYSKYLNGKEYLIFKDMYYFNILKNYQIISETMKSYVRKCIEDRAYIKDIDLFLNRSTNALTVLDGFDDEKINKNFSAYIKENKLSSAAIYGFGEREINLFGILLYNGIKDIYFISEEARERFKAEGLDGLRAYSPKESLPMCDAIIFLNQQICNFEKTVVKGDKDRLISIYDILLS